VNFSSFSAILDIIFGLIFTYFLLALVASGIQEIIASVFAWRGTYLSKGIDVILDNSSAARFAWVDLRDRLRAHFTPNPGQTVAEQLEQQIRQKQQGNATADQAVLLRVLNVQTHPLMRNVPTTLPSYVPARNFSLALLETLRDGSKTPLFSQAERTVAALPEGDLKKTLSLFLEDAGGDLDAFRAHLEHWFDDAMDRVSGIYTRLSQYVLLALGLVLAVGLNVDSIRLARTLWDTPALRTELVAIAASNNGTHVVPAAPSTAAQSEPLAQSVVRNGTAGISNFARPSQSPPPAVADVRLPVQDILEPYRELEATHIPFGWNIGNPNGAPNIGWSTVPGWCITAVAIGLGAPFWFSLLQTVGSMRNAGPKPKRTDASGETGRNLSA
jgi:hypothetical protein